MSSDQPTVYTKEEVRAACLAYFHGDELAASATMDKYLLKNGQGEFLERDPDDYFRFRLAPEFARIEGKYPNGLSEEEIYEALAGYRYVVCQGSPTFGIGNPYKVVSLSNCFCIGQPYDSYGGICQKDQQLVQIMKRRGGCVEQNSFVLSKKGLTRIKDVRVGDYVLSCNSSNGKPEWGMVTAWKEVEVPVADRVAIKYSNGAVLRTSSKHPVMTFGKDCGSEYGYRTVAEGLGVGDGGIRNCFEADELIRFDDALADIGWWLGCHTGNGSCDEVNGYKCRQARIRNVGAGQEVVEKYGRVVNELSGSACNCLPSRRKNHKTQCWEYTVSNRAIKPMIVDQYLDGEMGRKTYDGDVYSFIEKNNLWVPYLAGLIDADGNVKESGTIDLSICMKSVIDKLSSILSACGISCRIKTKVSSRPNESVAYRMTIHHSGTFLDEVCKYMVDEKKVAAIAEMSETYREFSRSFPVSDDEFNEIIGNYENGKYDGQYEANLVSIIRCFKRSRRIGIGGLKCFVNNRLIDADAATNISQRVEIESVEQETESGLVYVDIQVDGNHNYYAGNFGMVCIHNCGIDISSLRPRGSTVQNAALTSDGIGVFMQRYSNTTHEVAQNGRRGALLIGIDCLHPEIETFLMIKRDLQKVTGANVSVKWRDEFLRAVEKDEEVTLRFPVDATPEDAEVTRVVKAREIWNLFIESAWQSAEPGAFFWDRVINQSISDCYSENGFRTILANPCGELPLSSMGSCILMLLNLYAFVENPYTEKAKFDFELFEKYSRVAMRMTDDLVDLEMEKIQQIIMKIENDPEPAEVKATELNMWKEVLEHMHNGRRVGLGCTALGDALAALGIKYDSEESLEIAGSIFEAMHNNISQENAKLAEERGPFPIWDWEKEKDSHYIKILPEDIREEIRKHGRRNIALSTIPPCGTTSLLTQTTSGVEPVFRRSYTRRKKMTAREEQEGIKPDFVDADGIKWIHYEIKHHGVQRWMEASGNTDVSKSPYAGCDSSEIDPIFRVRMQALLQKYIQHSISSTINLPKTATMEQVDELYRLAWKEGCKGLTIYRDNCRDGVLITNKLLRPDKIAISHSPKRPKILPCEIHFSTIRGHRWIFMVGLLDDQPYEIFGGVEESINVPRKYARRGETKAWIIKNGKNEQGITTYNLVLNSLDDPEEKLEFADVAALFSPDMGTPTRHLSMLLRHGVPLQCICDQIMKVPQEDSMFTFERGVNRVLKKYIRNKTKTGKTCPKCGADLIYVDGCVKCSQCTWSQCD